MEILKATYEVIYPWEIVGVIASGKAVRMVDRYEDKILICNEMVASDLLRYIAQAEEYQKNGIEGRYVFYTVHYDNLNRQKSRRE